MSDWETIGRVPESDGWETVGTNPRAEIADQAGMYRGREGMAPEELRMDHAFRQEHMKTGRIRELERALGYQDLNPQSDLTFGQKIDLGYADNVDEVQHKLINMLPKDSLLNVIDGTLVYKRPDETEWRPTHDLGLSLDSITKLAGALPEVAGSAIAALFTGGSSIPVSALKMALGGQAGHLVKEGVEYLRGNQLETLPEIGQRVAVNTGIDTLTGMVPGFGLRGVDKLRGGDMAPTQAASRRNVEYLVNARPDIEGALYGQVSNNPAAQRLLAQSTSTSPELQSILQKQAESAVRLGREWQTRLSPAQGKAMQNRAATFAGQDIAGAKKPFYVGDYEKVGERVYSTAGPEWLAKSGKRVNAAYDKVRNAAQRERLTFDIGGAQETVKRHYIPGIADETIDTDMARLMSQPITDDAIEGFIDVAPSLRGNRTVRLLQELSPDQVSFDTIQTLKNGLSEGFAKTPWATTDEKHIAGKMREIWGSLDDTIANPIGASERYRSAYAKAKKTAADRFDVIDNNNWRAFYKSGDPRMLGEELTKPGKFTPQMRKALVQDTSPDRLEKIRTAYAHQILSSDKGPKATWDEIVKRDSRMAELMIPHSSGMRREFVKSMDVIEKARNNDLYTAFQKITDKTNAVEEAIYTEGVSADQVINMVKRAGGGKSPGWQSDVGQTVRAAIKSRIIRKSMAYGEDGQPTYSAARFSEAIDEAKTRNYYRLLSEREKKELYGLKAYTELLLASQKDFGTTLEQAQIISGLKDVLHSPGTAIKSLHALTMNNVIIANAMQQQGWVRRLMRKQRIPKEIKKAPWIWAAETAGVLAREASQSDRLVGEPTQ